MTEHTDQFRLIVAGSYQQAFDSAYNRGLNFRSWVYIHQINQLDGWRNPIVDLVGTYYERKDWPDLERKLDYIGAKIRYA